MDQLKDAPVTPPEDEVTVEATQPETAPAAVAPEEATTPVPDAPQTTPSGEAPQAAAVKAPKSKSQAPIGVVVSAIIVALSLAALTVFVFLRSDMPKQTTTQNKTTTPTANPQAETLKAMEVDATATELNKSLDDASDSSDFNEAELNDASLGL